MSILPDSSGKIQDGKEQWSSTEAVSHRSEYILLTCEVENQGRAGAAPKDFGSPAEN